MKKLFTLCVVIVAAFSSLSAQTVMFQKLYGDTYLNMVLQVRQTSDGGYIQCGYLGNGSTTDAWLMKTDAQGNITWSKTYGGSGEEVFSDVIQTTDGGYITSGWTNSNALSNYVGYAVKTDASGDTLWTKSYGVDGEDFAHVISCADGGYAFVGSTSNYSYGASNDLMVMKTNGTGSVQWIKAVGIPDSVDYGTGIRQTADQGFIVCGTVEYTGVDNVYLFKLNASGDTLWTRIFSYTDYMYGEDVITTSDGGYLVIGSVMNFVTNDHNIILIKTDVSGNIVWTNTYSSARSEECYGVIEVSGGYIISGFQVNSSNDEDVLFFKVGSSGNILWTKTYGSFQDDEGFHIAPTADGGFVASCYQDYFSVTNTVYSYIIKADGNGNAAGCNAGTPSLTSAAITLQTYGGGRVSSGNDSFKSTTAVSTVSTADSTLCFLIGIEENSENNLINIYPNPTSGLVTLDLGDAQNFNEIKIYNSIGALVGSENVKSVSGKVNIDLSKYGKGLFCLTSSNAENTFSVKVIVE